MEVFEPHVLVFLVRYLSVRSIKVKYFKGARGVGEIIPASCLHPFEMIIQ